MTDFGQLVLVLATCISSTIGVCVYLLKQQQKERERSEDRADQRIDKLFTMLDDRVKEQTDVLRDLAQAMNGLSSRMDHLERKIDHHGT